MNRLTMRRLYGVIGAAFLTLPAIIVYTGLYSLQSIPPDVDDFHEKLRGEVRLADEKLGSRQASASALGPAMEVLRANALLERRPHPELSERENAEVLGLLTPHAQGVGPSMAGSMESKALGIKLDNLLAEALEKWRPFVDSGVILTAGHITQPTPLAEYHALGRQIWALQRILIYRAEIHAAHGEWVEAVATLRTALSIADPLELIAMNTRWHAPRSANIDALGVAILLRYQRPPEVLEQLHGLLLERMERPTQPIAHHMITKAWLDEFESPAFSQPESHGAALRVLLYHEGGLQPGTTHAIAASVISRLSPGTFQLRSTVAERRLISEVSRQAGYLHYLGYDASLQARLTPPQTLAMIKHARNIPNDGFPEEAESQRWIVRGLLAMLVHRSRLEQAEGVTLGATYWEQFPADGTAAGDPLRGVLPEDLWPILPSEAKTPMAERTRLYDETGRSFPLMPLRMEKFPDQPKTHGHNEAMYHVSEPFRLIAPASLRTGTAITTGATSAAFQLMLNQGLSSAIEVASDASDSEFNHIVRYTPPLAESTTILADALVAFRVAESWRMMPGLQDVAVEIQRPDELDEMDGFISRFPIARTVSVKVTQESDEWESLRRLAADGQPLPHGRMVQVRATVVFPKETRVLSFRPIAQRSSVSLGHQPRPGNLGVGYLPHLY